MLAYDTTLYTTGTSLKSIMQIKNTQLCLTTFECDTMLINMLINPVKTKSTLINTREKHQLSDLSLRLSLDGQNIQNTTEHQPLGLIAGNKCRWPAKI